MVKRYSCLWTFVKKGLLKLILGSWTQRNRCPHQQGQRTGSTLATPTFWKTNAGTGHAKGHGSRSKGSQETWNVSSICPFLSRAQTSADEWQSEHQVIHCALLKLGIFSFRGIEFVKKTDQPIKKNPLFTGISWRHLSSKNNSSNSFHHYSIFKTIYKKSCVNFIKFSLLSFADVGKRLGEMWHSLSEDEKEEYRRRSRAIADQKLREWHERMKMFSPHQQASNLVGQVATQVIQDSSSNKLVFDSSMLS